MSDESIKKQVVDQLFWDDSVKASDVKVEVNKGVVNLEGTVPSFRAKDSAYANALWVDGVRSVNDFLTVKYPEVKIPTDQEISTEIMNSIFWDPDLKEMKLDVEVKKGVATLTGNVDSYWKKELVEEKAMDVFGVVEIKNKVAVVPTETYDDETIAQDIVKAFERNIFLDPKTVDVLVQNGKVTLSGELPSWNAVKEAVRVASNTAGVIDLDDKELLIA